DRMTALKVDNRGGVAAKLTCGQLEFAIPADSTTARSFPTPQRPQDTLLVLDGNKLGAVEADVYLVDVSGRRSYQKRWVSYAFFNIGEAPAVPAPQLFAKGHLHRVGKIDYFLTAAPQTIKRELTGGPQEPVTVTELLEIGK